MDGLNFLPAPDRSGLSHEVVMQRTLKAPIDCTGIGLHSGRPVSVRLVPAACDSGIVFMRTDAGVAIAARFDTVVDTRLCTVIGPGDGSNLRVGTIEHLMAALACAGVDNAVVELDGAEVPVLDGSAEPWLFLLECAGTVAQESPRRVIEVLRPVRVEDGDAFAELRPHGPAGAGFDLSLSIDFEAPAIGRQALNFTLAPEAGPGAFRRELARARTFAQRHEIEGLQRAGLALGGSLDNAVVVDGAAVLNPAGLRMDGEFVRHKMLDAVGDLFLAGGAVQGRFVGHKSGHALNNRVLRALFADAANWRYARPVEMLLAA